MQILIFVGSDFLGRLLPAYLATALPKGAVRMIEKLWVDGVEARRAGGLYRHPPFLRPSAQPSLVCNNTHASLEKYSSLVTVTAV